MDLDLGNYERFLNVSLGRDNNITTGKAVQKLATFFWGARYDLLVSKTDKNKRSWILLYFSLFIILNF